MEQHKSSRILYLDLLKILSIYFVILIHVTAENWYDDIQGVYWLVNNGYNALSRWGVPVFCMVSGALLLSRDIPIRKIYTHYLPRIALLLLIWGLAYEVLTAGGLSVEVLLGGVRNLLRGKAYSHLWYLYMIMGLYIITPPLRAMIRGAEQKTLTYFLVCAFLFAVALPRLLTLSWLEPYGGWINKLDVQLFGGYIFYYVAGWYLHQFALPKWARRTLYLCGGLLLVGAMVVSEIRSLQLNYQYVNYGVFSLGTAVFSLALFVLCRSVSPRLEQSPWLSRMISFTGPLTFGIYLCHFMVEKLLLRFGLHSNVIHPLLGAPLVSLLIFLLSGGICWLLRKIPLLRRLVE